MSAIDTTAPDPQPLTALLEVLGTLNSPDTVEAKQILLRRLALEGDVIGSRVPPPLNITEIGGYLNLLGTLQQPEMQAQVLAGILGVAGPNPPLGWLTAAQPLSLVPITNDRPPGAAQPSLPLTFSVRSDFLAGLQNALDYLHQRGASLPVMAPTMVTLPAAQQGATPPTDPLPYLGRTIDLAGTAALAAPATDPLGLVRPQGATGDFQLAANVDTAAATVATAPASYDALQCDATSCSVISLTNQSVVLLQPVLAQAGFYPASPLPQPTTSSDRSWARLTNVTGLQAGVTKLGDELALLFGPTEIAGSAFASALSRTWNGTTFA